MTFESIWEREVGLLVSKFSVFIFSLLEGERNGTTFSVYYNVVFSKPCTGAF